MVAEYERGSAASRVAGSPGMGVDARWEVLRPTALFRGVLAPLVLRNGPMWPMLHGRFGANKWVEVAEYER